MTAIYRCAPAPGHVDLADTAWDKTTRDGHVGALRDTRSAQCVSGWITA